VQEKSHHLLKKIIRGLVSGALILPLLGGCHYFQQDQLPPPPEFVGPATELQANLEAARTGKPFFVERLRHQKGERFYALVAEREYGRFLGCVWVTKIREVDGVFAGAIYDPANSEILPRTIKFSKRDVIDWMIVDKGRRYGGFVEAPEP